MLEQFPAKRQLEREAQAKQKGWLEALSTTTPDLYPGRLVHAAQGRPAVVAFESQVTDVCPTIPHRKHFKGDLAAVSED